jgi:hypothetical protein
VERGNVTRGGTLTPTSELGPVTAVPRCPVPCRAAQPGIAARSSVASEAYYTHGKMITTDIRKKIFDNARYKTQPCTQWKNSGSCKFGKTCVYYHGVSGPAPDTAQTRSALLCTSAAVAYRCCYRLQEEEKMSFRTHVEREIPYVFTVSAWWYPMIEMMSPDTKFGVPLRHTPPCVAAICVRRG